MTKNYSRPKTNILYIEEQPLCAALSKPAVNQSGTETDTNKTAGGGNAGGAHAKPSTPWADDESFYND